MRWVASLVAAIAATLALAAGPATARGVDETCVLALTEFDPGTVNIAFPDQSADYWSGAFVAVPGVRIRIQGRFPHARYMSWMVYDAQLRAVDGITDLRIEPRPGSSNPFVPGADRYAKPRRYSLFIEPGPKPANPRPNTIYTGAPTNLASVFTYRTYIPDGQLDPRGGVPLPRAIIEPARGHDRPISPVDCSQVRKPSIAGLNERIANLSPPPQLDGLLATGQSPPLWHKFVNLPIGVADNAFGSPRTAPIREALDRLPLAELGGQGGVLNNLDNAYVYAPVHRGWGQVLVLRGKAPTFADTWPRAPVMPGGKDLRYWSLCQNEPTTQRFVACLPDYRTVLDSEGYYTTVVSTPAQRPRNARPACGVNWLPWGPSARGLLILRNMLPSPGFDEAIQNATYGRERETMGEYLPTGRYLPDRRAFERRGCQDG